MAGSFVLVRLVVGRSVLWFDTFLYSCFRVIGPGLWQHLGCSLVLCRRLESNDWFRRSRFDRGFRSLFSEPLIFRDNLWLSGLFRANLLSVEALGQFLYNRLRHAALFTFRGGGDGLSRFILSRCLRGSLFGLA